MLTGSRAFQMQLQVFSKDYGSALHRTSDTQLSQVCGQQEPERVHERFETRISGYRRGLSDCHQELAVQPGTDGPATGHPVLRQFLDLSPTASFIWSSLTILIT